MDIFCGIREAVAQSGRAEVLVPRVVGSNPTSCLIYYGPLVKRSRRRLFTAVFGEFESPTGHHHRCIAVGSRIEKLTMQQKTTAFGGNANEDISGHIMH